MRGSGMTTSSLILNALVCLAIAAVRARSREREVMRHVIAGRPNKLIADALDISVRTVEVHRARLFDKMKVKSAVELANLVRGAGASVSSAE